MAQYLDYEIDTDPQSLAEDAFDELQAQIPGWVPADANLETLFIMALSQMAGELRDVAALVPTTIFRYFGTLVGIDALDSSKAQVATTWVFSDSLGHTIEAGTVAGFRTAGDELIPFEVATTITIPAGTSGSAAGGVLMTAVDEGAEASGLGGAGQTMELITPIASVSSITMTEATHDGQDAESDEDYLNRLSSKLRLLKPTAVTPGDFEIAARDNANVDRAQAIDMMRADGNELTLNQGSVETDTTGFSSDTNCSISRVTTQSADGVASLQLSSTAGGDMIAGTSQGASGRACIPFVDYTALVSIKPNVNARLCSVAIRFFTSGGSTISTTFAADVAQPNTQFTQMSVTARAPSNAAFMAVLVRVKGTAGAAELAFADKWSVHKGYNLQWQPGGTPTTGVDRSVTVFVIDENGLPLGTGAKAELLADLQALREVNFLVYVEDPQYTFIDVTFTGKAQAGYDPASVEAAAEAAVASYLDPKNWGRPQWTTGTEPDDWLQAPVVRYTELIQVINNVEGFDYLSGITPLQLAIQGQSLGTSDVNLAPQGFAPLPKAGTINGTVT